MENRSEITTLYIEKLVKGDYFREVTGTVFMNTVTPMKIFTVWLIPYHIYNDLDREEEIVAVEEVLGPRDRKYYLLDKTKIFSELGS